MKKAKKLSERLSKSITAKKTNEGIKPDQWSKKNLTAISNAFKKADVFKETTVFDSAENYSDFISNISDIMRDLGSDNPRSLIELFTALLKEAKDSADELQDLDWEEDD